MIQNPKNANKFIVIENISGCLGWGGVDYGIGTGRWITHGHKETWLMNMFLGCADSFIDVYKISP
jgi:hypothetical protein